MRRDDPLERRGKPPQCGRQAATVRSASRHSAVGKPPQCGRPTARQPSVPAIVAGWNRAAGRIAAGADGAAAAPAGTGLPAPGSPLYGDLLGHAAGDLLAAGPAADVLEGHLEDRGRSALALRMLGGAHALALSGA